MKVKHTAIIYIIIGLFHIYLSNQSTNKIEFNKLINDLGTFSEDSKTQKLVHSNLPIIRQKR
mgnify:CR=1 FL=1